MKSKILSFVLLLCAATAFSQTLLQYPLSSNFNPNIGPAAGMSPTIGYFNSVGTPKAPAFANGFMTIQDNNDYLLLNFNATNYEDLSVEFDARLWALFAVGTVNLYMQIGSNPEVLLDSKSFLSIIFPDNKSFSSQLTGADHQSSVSIRIEGVDFSVIGGLGIKNLKIKSKNTIIEVKRNASGFPVIPYGASASTIYDTDFGSLLTMEEHKTKEFQIKNTGSNNLKIDHFEIIQSDNDFKFEGTLPTAGTTSPNGTKTFNIRFEPQDQGLKVAEIRIYANILPDNPFVFQVIGYGKSCNLVPVPIATQHFEDSPQNMGYNIVSGTLRMINGNSKKNQHTPLDGSDLYPNNTNMFVAGGTSSNGLGTSWYARGIETGEVTLEFGEADVSNQQEVSIYFEVAAFGETNNSNSGVNQNDYVILSLWDEANNSWSNQIRLNGSNSNNTRYRYEFGKALYTKTTITSSVQSISNDGSTKYGKIEQKIPASFIPASGKLKFRIKAKTGNNNGLWLIDNVQVKAGNAIAKVWNGSSWPDGKPGEREKALFDGNYNFSGTQNVNLKICECEVNDGKNLIIPNGRTLTVRNKVINNQSNGENFVVQDGANLIQLENSIQNEGKIKVEKYVQDMNNVGPAYDYVYWSSPVAGQNLHNFSPDTPFGHNKWGFLWYNEADDYFYNVDTDIEPDFVPGKGYAIRAEDNPGPSNPLPNPYTKTYSFIGTPNNGRVLFPLKKVRNGYNLIGNPYPSNISANELYNLNKSLIYNTFYFWTNNNPVPNQQGGSYSGNNYAVWNGTGGNSATTAADPGSGSWSMNKVPNGTISVGQGVIVEAKASGDLVFLNNNPLSGEMVRVSTAADFFQKADKDRFWLSLTSPSQIINTTLIGYIPGAVNDYDKDFDAEFWGASDAIYSIISNRQLIIQGREYPLEISDVVPLGVKFFEDGAYEIDLQNPEGIFANKVQVLLKDKQLNVIHDFKNGFYRFEARKGEFTDRFEIIYKKRPWFSEEQVVANPLITITRQSEDLLIMSKGDKLSEVKVYNLLGKPVFTYKDLNTEELRIPATEYSKQILIVNIVTQSGKTVSQKVIPK